MRIPALFLLLFLDFVCGCGVPGAPQAPTLGIPNPAGNLQAVRKGPVVSVSWDVPTETTDGELIRKPGRMVVSRSAAPGSEFRNVREITLPPALQDTRPTRASMTDDISTLLEDPATGDFISYHVVTISSAGRAGGASDNVSVPAVITAAPPRAVGLALGPQGVTVSFEVPWPQPKPTRLAGEIVYRVMRKQDGAAEAVSAAQLRPESGALVFVDSAIEWEKTYQYWVTPVTLWHSASARGEVEGEDSPIASIVAHDSFPPATPSGLQAVFSGLPQRPFIDLTWAPNTDQDLAGYNVYRRTESGVPEKLNTGLLKTPAFHDGSVEAGVKYIYSVAAVDVRGNESARSEEASELVPKD